MKDRKIRWEKIFDFEFVPPPGKCSKGGLAALTYVQPRRSYQKMNRLVSELGNRVSTAPSSPDDFLNIGSSFSRGGPLPKVYDRLGRHSLGKAGRTTNIFIPATAAGRTDHESRIGTACEIVQSIELARIKKLLGWRHSGFSIHNQVRIAGHAPNGREKLAQYILRAPFSQQKMHYHARSHTVIYRSKMHHVLKHKFEGFPVLDWIAAVTAHIPNKGEHLFRYFWLVQPRQSEEAQESRGASPTRISRRARRSSSSARPS